MTAIKKYEESSNDYPQKTYIKQGTFGIVYRVGGEENQAALKIAISAEENGYSSVKHEFQVLQAIGRHSNIIELINGYDDPDKGRFAFSMELADGGTVQDEINRRKELTETSENAAFNLEELHSFCIKILGALDHIHSKGYCHLDLKPENIVLFGNRDFKDKVPKLIDFGVAQKVEEGLRMPLGNPVTMAPEVENAAARPLEGDYTKADMFSFGAVLFLMIRCKNGADPSMHLHKIKKSYLKAKCALFIQNGASQWEGLGKFNLLIGFYLLNWKENLRMTAKEAIDYIGANLTEDFKTDGKWQGTDNNEESDFGHIPQLEV